MPCLALSQRGGAELEHRVAAQSGNLVGKGEPLCAQAVERSAAAAAFGLVPGGERIADPGGEKARRRGRDDGRIDDHHVGIAQQEKIVVDGAVFAVDHRERTARRV